MLVSGRLCSSASIIVVAICSFCGVQPVMPSPEEPALSITFINLSPEQLRVCANPQTAKSERTEPLFADGMILQTYPATVAAKMKSESTSFPKEWAKMRVPTGNTPFSRAVRRKRVTRSAVDVMCMVVQTRGEAISNVVVRFKYKKIEQFRGIFDDNEVLRFGPDSDMGAEAFQASGVWTKATRAIRQLGVGRSLICPLYICEWLEATQSAEENDDPWRVARGEIWVPEVVRFNDSSGAEHYRTLDKVTRRYSRYGPEDGQGEENNLNVVQTNLTKYDRSAPPESAPITTPIRSTRSGRWLATYFSFNDLIKVASERSKKNDNDAFLDFPWIRSGIMMPEEKTPPTAEEVMLAKTADKPQYQQERARGELAMGSAEVVNLSLRLVGNATTNARVKVRRIKLRHAVELFRSDGSLTTDDYESLLSKVGTYQEELLPIGAIDAGWGVNVPLFVVRDVERKQHGPRSSWRFIFDEVILPISIIEEEGNRLYETPIRRMNAVPWRISAEIFGRA